MLNRIILKETFIQNSIIRYLSEKGWNQSLRFANLWEHGVDIKVKNKKIQSKIYG